MVLAATIVTRRAETRVSFGARSRACAIERDRPLGRGRTYQTDRYLCSFGRDIFLREELGKVPFPKYNGFAHFLNVAKSIIDSGNAADLTAGVVE